MGENKSRYEFKGIALVIMLGVLIFSVFKICAMSEDIAAMKNSIANYQGQINSLNHEINSIYDNVDKLLKKQSSLVSSIDYTFGELDTESHTIPLTLSIVPKTLTDDMTLSVRIGEVTADFIRDGDVFTSSITVGLFLDDEQYPILSIKSGNETKTEQLDEVFVANLHHKYLPGIYADISLSYDYSRGQLKIDGDFYVSVVSEGPITVTKMELVTELNGKEIERQDITAYARNEEYNTAYKKTYSAGEGDELVVYVIAEDSLGYVHKTRALYLMQKDGGVYEEVTFDDGGEIYDKNGNLLK